MKKIQYIINVVLGLAVAILFTLFVNQKQKINNFQSSNKTEVSDGKKIESVDSILKNAKELPFPIAFVNIDTIEANFIYYKQQKENLEKSINSKQQILLNKEQKLNSDYEKFAMEVQNGTTKLVTRAELEKEDMKFQRLMQGLMLEKQKMEEEVVNQENNLVKEINTSLDSFLKKYKDELKYSYVFQKGGMAGTLLYANDSLDITKDVLKALNAEYANKVK